MQGLTVDNLKEEEIKRLAEALPKFSLPSAVDGVYWIELPSEVLSPTQQAHTSCHPHCIAVELGEDFINFDFLVRTFQRVRCDCIAPATNQQKLYILEVAKKIFSAAGVPFAPH